MVERGTEGLLAVQRQVAAVQASAQEGLQQCTAELRHRLEELHRNHHRHQDLIQVGLPSALCPPPSALCPLPSAHISAHTAFTLHQLWRAREPESRGLRL